MGDEALRRAELDGMCCDCGDTDTCGVVLRAGCHPKAGFGVKYFRAHGSIVIYCAKCGQHVSHVAVAASEKS